MRDRWPNSFGTEGWLELPKHFRAYKMGTKRVRVHAKAYSWFKVVVQHIDGAGRGKLVKQFQTLNRRQCRNGGHWISGCVSLHSWALAVDINPSYGGFSKAWWRSGKGRPIRRIFQEHRFVWGGDWNDAVHFQWAR